MPKTIPDNNGSTIIYFLEIVFIIDTNICSILKIYLNPIAACQTKAKSKKKTGTIGKISIIGLKIIYASGNRAKSNPSIIRSFSNFN